MLSLKRHVVRRKQSRALMGPLYGHETEKDHVNVWVVQSSGWRLRNPSMPCPALLLGAPQSILGPLKGDKWVGPCLGVVNRGRLHLWLWL